MTTAQRYQAYTELKQRAKYWQDFNAEIAHELREAADDLRKGHAYLAGKRVRSALAMARFDTYATMGI